MRIQARLAAVALVLGALAVPARAASGADADRLAALINAYRGEAQTCEGRRVGGAGPLAPDRRLADAPIPHDGRLTDALRRAGYAAAYAQVIVLTGPQDPQHAMRLLVQRHCAALLQDHVADIGIARTGATWRILLAQPLLPEDLGGWREAGQVVLALVNEARARPRACGDRRYPAAPRLQWNDRLGQAALAHSRDMAQHRRLAHRGRDGSEVGNRADRAGYAWRAIGENIATGQGSPQQVVASWIASPEHCANLMDQAYTDMGAAYAINRDADTVIYWTQVLGTQRR